MPLRGERADARHERRLAGRELRVRGRQRVEERVEIEQLLHFAAAQDQHRSPDGTRCLPDERERPVGTVLRVEREEEDPLPLAEAEQPRR